MNPGDIIEVADGTYNLSSVKITRSGCQKRPIIIRAQHQGQAIFNGSTAFVLESIQYVTLQGFSFQSENIGTGIKLQNSSYTRITGNNFAIKENSSCNWVYIGDTFGSTEPLKSGHNLIDHNVFDGKTQPGKYIVLDGNINQQSQYDTIRYNLFKNNGPRVANEKESIRIGVSALSKSSGFTVVEYNLFQDCDGDPEIVSVKSCDNMVRYNTFQRCLGTVCLRQGERSVVEGNYFFGEGKTAIFTDEDSGSSSTIGCGGVRVYGRGHKVINNYFEGLTGDRWDAACTITNGDVTNSSTSLSDHYLPEDLVFAFNTLVNNKSNVEIGFDNGGKYSKYPINCQIANNIVVANANPIIKSYSTSALAGVSFSNNIMYPTGTASIGISATSSQVINTDPKLIHPACSGSDCALTTAARIFRLSENSPAIDAATGDFNFVTLDNEAQSRTGLKDIGATEYKPGTTITTGALNDENVGPNAVAFTYSYNSSSTLPVKLTGFQAIAQGNQVQLRWNTASEINVKQYDVQGQIADGSFKTIVTVMASGSRQYSAQHTNPLAGWNYYRLKITDNDGSFDYSPVAAAKILTAGAVVFPNPADQFVNISLDNVPANGTRLNLVNLQGVVVQTIPAKVAARQTLTTTDLPTGIYQLQVIEPGRKPVSYPVVIAH
ncbi:T9SS type A sorting domain-containing protein (plasmid) [Pedobacter sp. BS3]|uniref:chondroitinase-B domain-containing protein n=1 Tax=Pedobacter sp. BS3 TaxID=2567937 RepID=UPI0011EF2702|nr:chondroitinase-B domain-containing protein [Pedobacter sp. BS3]TZF85898.1 T9SS type A sorting domain-containing protein [Pedobacter sp. BS3]